MPLTASPVEQPLGRGTFAQISAISSVEGRRGGRGDMLHTHSP